MPRRSSPPDSAIQPPQDNEAVQGSFRRRYDELETRRGLLLDRLNGLGDKAHAHPGYKRALILLNTTFRKAKLAQRLAILQSASWLIDILERLTL